MRHVLYKSHLVHLFSGHYKRSNLPKNYEFCMKRKVAGKIVLNVQAIR